MALGDNSRMAEDIDAVINERHDLIANRDVLAHAVNNNCIQLSRSRYQKKIEKR